MPKSSAAGLPSSGTDANSTRGPIISACAAAADDLAKTRALANALDAENTKLKERLETERRTVDLLNELNAARKSETDALRKALAANSETISAKEAVIASQDKLIETLKRKRTSPWKRITDVLIGAAVFAILK